MQSLWNKANDPCYFKTRYIPYLNEYVNEHDIYEVWGTVRAESIYICMKYPYVATYNSHVYVTLRPETKLSHWNKRM